MAKRKFKLPGIQDLSKEQDKVRMLPKEGQHLIIGGPGTGKSVVALGRTQRHARDKDRYVFLVFNHILNQASRALYGENLNSSTWDAWFRKLFEQSAGHPIPQRPAMANGYRPIDWNRTIEAVRTLAPRSDEGRPFLIIDEGQDMPPQFYCSLVELGYENFFVVADQNQQIKDENSSRGELQDCLAIDARDVVELTENYRNRRPVAVLAREFYADDRATPPPDLPTRPGSTPTLYTYRPDEFGQVARRILRFADRDPSQLIGVVTPNNLVRERYVRALANTDVPLDNARPKVSTFHTQARPKVAFDEGGILVINAQACKGLEFDTVILADIDEHYFRRSDPDTTRRLFYVMVARARDRAFLFTKAPSKPVLEILPEDSNVLQRESI